MILDNKVEYVCCEQSVDTYFLHTIKVNGTEVKLHSKKTEDEYRKALASAAGAAEEIESQEKTSEESEEEDESMD